MERDENKLLIEQDLKLLESRQLSDLENDLKPLDLKGKIKVLRNLTEYLNSMNSSLEKQESFLMNCTNVCSLILSEIDSSALREAFALLYRLVQLLDREDIVLSVRCRISRLCEDYFLKSFPESSRLLPSLFTFLVAEALRPTSKENYVKRLLAISHGFDALDFSSSDHIFSNSFLLRCFVHPSFLRSKEGKKVLSVLAAANEGYLLEDVRKIIKGQVMNGVKHVCVAYGEVLYQLWKEIDEKDLLQGRIAQTLQDFIYEAVHTTNPRYFKGLRFMIKAFHDVKRGESFETALSKIFEPILWRSLQCANAVVRTQASILFFDVFPLQNLSLNSEQLDIYMQKQFDQLASLLKDSDHRVRSTAAIGAFQVLKDYWEILPASTILNLLKYFFEVLVHDAADPSVRISILVGVRELLSQTLAHNSLHNLLPLIAKSLNDRSERVRLEFIRLLEKISALKSFHYYDIVEVTSIMERLVMDQHNPQITRAVCELLQPSFFPVQGSSEDQLQRCLQFIETNADAATIFYGHLKGLVPIGSVVKLAAILFQLLLANLSKQPSKIPKVSSKSTGKRGRARAENSCEVCSMPLADRKLVFGILDILNSILASTSEDISRQVPSLELFLRYFTASNLYSAFEEMISLFEMKPLAVSSAFKFVRQVLQIYDADETTGSDQLANALKLFSHKFFISTLSQTPISILPSTQRVFLTHFVEASRCFIILKKNSAPDLEQLLCCRSSENKASLLLFQITLRELLGWRSAVTDQQQLFYQLEASIEKIRPKLTNYPFSSQLIIIQALLTIALFKNISTRVIQNSEEPMCTLDELIAAERMEAEKCADQDSKSKIFAVLFAALQSVGAFNQVNTDLLREAILATTSLGLETETGLELIKTLPASQAVSGASQYTTKLQELTLQLGKVENQSIIW